MCKMVKFYAPKGLKVYKATATKKNFNGTTVFSIYFRKGKFKIPFPLKSTVQGSFQAVGLDADKKGNYIEYKKIRKT